MVIEGLRDLKPSGEGTMHAEPQAVYTRNHFCCNSHIIPLANYLLHSPWSYRSRRGACRSTSF